eukprot:2552708-Rhodomonas_salina.1
MELLRTSSTNQMMARQNELPRLPIPSLEESVEDMLRAIAPHVSAEKLAETKSKTETFIQSDGPRLHQALIEYDSVPGRKKVTTYLPLFARTSARLLSTRIPSLCLSTPSSNGYYDPSELYPHPLPFYRNTQPRFVALTNIVTSGRPHTATDVADCALNCPPVVGAQVLPERSQTQPGIFSPMDLSSLAMRLPMMTSHMVLPGAGYVQDYSALHGAGEHPLPEIVRKKRDFRTVCARDVVSWNGSQSIASASKSADPKLAPALYF